MADIVFIGIIVLFFALCVLYVNWCDRIIGDDQSAVSGNTTTPAGDDAALNEEIAA